MIYIYAVLLIVNTGSGIVAFIAGDYYELLRHNVTVVLLILITLETKKNK